MSVANDALQHAVDAIALFSSDDDQDLRRAAILALISLAMSNAVIATNQTVQPSPPPQPDPVNPTPTPPQPAT